MAKLSIVALGLSLAGCAGGMSLPPPSPTTTQIAAIEQTLQASGIPPSVYVSIGITLESQQCNSWFGSQISAAQQTNLAQGALGVGAGAAGVAAGPAGAGAAAAMGILSALLGNNQANSAVGTDPTGVYILVNRTLQAWQSAAQNPQSIEDAYAFVESYSELCQLPGIQSAIRMAVMTAPVRATQPTGLGEMPYSASPQRVLPPVVSVGTPATTTTPTAPPRPVQRQVPQLRQQRESKGNSPNRFLLGPSHLGDNDEIEREWDAIRRAGGRAAYERDLGPRG